MALTKRYVWQIISKLGINPELCPELAKKFEVGYSRHKQYFASNSAVEYMKESGIYKRTSSFSLRLLCNLGFEIYMKKGLAFIFSEDEIELRKKKDEYQKLAREAYAAEHSSKNSKELKIEQIIEEDSGLHLVDMTRVA